MGKVRICFRHSFPTCMKDLKAQGPHSGPRRLAQAQMSLSKGGALRAWARESGTPTEQDFCVQRPTTAMPRHPHHPAPPGPTNILQRQPAGATKLQAPPAQRRPDGRRRPPARGDCWRQARPAHITPYIPRRWFPLPNLSRRNVPA